MHSCFSKLQRLLASKNINIANKKLNQFICDYNFFHILDEPNIDQKEIINQNLKKSNLVIFNKSNEDYFIIGFEKTIILIKEKDLPILNQYFTSISDLTICFLSDIKHIFDQYIKISYTVLEYSSKLANFAMDFNQNLYFRANKEISQIWKDIKPCISAYLIKKNIKKDRIENFQINSSKSEDIKNDDYINLTKIESGSIFRANLIYHIEKEEMYIIKTPYSNDEENAKLISREYDNYMKLNHPLLPRFIGKTEKDNNNVIEYIDGISLQNIKRMKLNDSEKITLIFELMIIIDYLHFNHFIYRDLKPNNVIMDQNKTTVLIDFDRMLDSNEEPKSNNFSSDFVAPEVNSQNFTYKCDIYSLGQMINYIINSSSSEINKNIQIERLYKMCTEETPEKRPNILDLVIEFYLNFRSQIKLNDFKNFFETDTIKAIKDINEKNKDQFTLFSIAKFYICYEKRYYDINKGIYYLSMAASNNDSKAQCMLGEIYINKNFGKLNANKAFYFLNLSANQNNADAQFMLGFAYYIGYYCEKDINKAMNYFIKSAEQNNAEAEYRLGEILLFDENVKHDINKALYYYKKSADHNHELAQCKLGIIYYNGQYIQKDIKKSIYYFTQAEKNNYEYAKYYLELIQLIGNKYQDINLGIPYQLFDEIFENKNKHFDKLELCLGLLNTDEKKKIYHLTQASEKNNSIAQYYLGAIYFRKNDMDNSIHYLTLSADNNNPDAQFMLGDIYFYGNYGFNNINKAIYYLELASKNNHSKAQYYLACIYDFGLGCKPDINRAIYYYKLSANNNDSNAQFNLAQLYEDGLKVPVDIKQSIYYYELAVKQNHYKSMYNLACLYVENNSIPHDIPKAIFLFEKCADVFPQALFNLGIIYFELNNIDKCLKSFYLAAKKNCVEAYNYLGYFYYKGVFVPQDINTAIKYFSFAADKNNPIAQFYLGAIYYNNKIYIKSFHFFKLSAKQNFPYAQFYLGLLYFNKNFVHRNTKMALYYLKKSLMNGCKEALFVFGCLYQEGKYVKKNIQESIRYYKESTLYSGIKYDGYAKNNLGVIYLNGIGVKKNIFLAKEYFEEAIHNENNEATIINLLCLCLNEDVDDYCLNKSLNLALKLLYCNFEYSDLILCLILIKKFGLDINNIIYELSKRISNYDDIIPSVIVSINEYELNNPDTLNETFKEFENTGFFYYFKKPNVFIYKSSKGEFNEISQVDINSDFYDGFGINLNT